jgi:hypothetical protein
LPFCPEIRILNREIPETPYVQKRVHETGFRKKDPVNGITLNSVMPQMKIIPCSGHLSATDWGIMTISKSKILNLLKRNNKEQQHEFEKNNYPFSSVVLDARFVRRCGPGF